MKKKISTVERNAFVEEFAIASVALHLADALEKSGLTQREIARALDVSEARISQIFDLESNPTVRSLARIADAIGCEVRIDFIPECHFPVEREPWDVIEVKWKPATAATLPELGYILEDVNEAA